MTKEVFLGHTGLLNFPRDFGIPERFIINNKDEYLDIIQEYNGRRNCYVSVYRYRDIKDYNSAIIDTVYIDMDDENTPPSIWNVYRETKRLVLCLMESNIIPRIYFSGNKGFAVYIDFPVVSLNYPKKTIRKFVNKIEEELKLTMIDKAPLGDLARISRIPNTQHMKSGLFCVPLEINEFLSFLNEKGIREIAKQPRNNYVLLKQPSKVVNYTLKKIDKEIDKEIEEEELLSFHSFLANRGKKKYKNTNGITQTLGKIQSYFDFRLLEGRRNRGWMFLNRLMLLKGLDEHSRKSWLYRLDERYCSITGKEAQKRQIEYIIKSNYTIDEKEWKDFSNLFFKKIPVCKNGEKWNEWII
jgi:hypothetical protein